MTGGGASPRLAGSGAARGGAPGLAPPPGAAGSEPARPELARGAEQGGRGRPEEGPGAARGSRARLGGLWHLGAEHTKGSAARPPVASWGGAESRMGSKIGDPWGRGLPSAHWPCLGLGFGFLRRAVGGRRRPAEGRDLHPGWR